VNTVNCVGLMEREVALEFEGVPEIIWHIAKQCDADHLKRATSFSMLVTTEGSQSRLSKVLGVPSRYEGGGCFRRVPVGVQRVRIKSVRFKSGEYHIAARSDHTRN